MSSKTIDELWEEWEVANQWAIPSKAYRAGHLQGCKDSLELLKRAYDAINECRYGIDPYLREKILSDMQEHIGYIEEQGS